MNTPVTRRHALKAVAAAALAPYAGSLAADVPAKIRIGQLGTSHAHASGKMDAIRSLADLYEVAGIAEPIAGRQANAEKQSPMQD